MGICCRACEAPIMFTLTEKGRMLPVNVAPVKDGTGNLRLEHRQAGPPLSFVVKPGEGTHVSHFATCPKAPQFRRKR
jgi:hypothetical protein